LKENAQIMFIKNNKSKRYYNGKIAKVTKIDEDGIVAELSENNQIIVEKETNGLMAAIKYRNDIETEKFKRYFQLFALRLSSYKEKYDSAKSDLDNLKIHNTDLQNNIVELNNTIKEKEKKNSEQNDAIKLLLDKRKELEIFNNNQTEVLKSMQLALNEKDINVKNLDTDKNKLSKDLNDLTKRYEKEIMSLKQEIERLNNLKWYQTLIGKK
jgi:chromosome segregation ATPase